MKKQQPKDDGPKHNFQPRQCAISAYQAAYDYSPKKAVQEKPPVPKINMKSV
jgi:hypothetical protein